MNFWVFYVFTHYEIFFSPEKPVRAGEMHRHLVL